MNPYPQTVRLPEQGNADENGPELFGSRYEGQQ